MTKPDTWQERFDEKWRPMMYAQNGMDMFDFIEEVEKQAFRKGVEAGKKPEIEKCKCGEPSPSHHSCPYRSDVGNDSESMCNCCEKCEHECAMDI